MRRSRALTALILGGLAIVGGCELGARRGVMYMVLALAAAALLSLCAP